jgi:hypothetical protein
MVVHDQVVDMLPSWVTEVWGVFLEDSIDIAARGEDSLVVPTVEVLPGDGRTYGGKFNGLLYKW